MIKHNVENKIKQINIGVELLRFILCLWIVIVHCSDIKNEHKKYFAKGFHVPTFIFISFYFFYPTLEGRDISKIILRFKRLLLPYILWPLIFFILKNYLIRIIPNNLTLKDIYIQILIGTQFHRIFWFQFNLIFLSLFLSIITFIFKSNFLIALKFIGIISLYLHFSGINYSFFNSTNENYRMSLGSLIELIPLTAISSFFNSVNVLTKIKRLSLHIQLILFSLILFLFKYRLFIGYRGCMYSNVLLYIHASTILFLFFGSLTFDNTKVIIPVIKYITKFTGGIYYIHPVVGEYLRNYLLFFDKKSYFSAIIIYILNYIFCFFCNKIFKNNTLRYLFI